MQADPARITVEARHQRPPCMPWVECPAQKQLQLPALQAPQQMGPAWEEPQVSQCEEDASELAT